MLNEEQKSGEPEDQNGKLKESIKKFAESYKNLNGNAKIIFENQILAQMRTMDSRTKLLYEALLDATKNDLNIDKTIKEMERADRVAKSGI